jgi:predicted transglutaminase-like cysteine proteinase
MMFRLPVIVASAFAALVLVLPSVAVGDVVSVPSKTQDATSLYMRVFGVTSAPYGFVQFCDRNTAACQDASLEETRMPGIGEFKALLDRVNRSVNAEIEPVTDRELYGVTEFWTIPTQGKGDCEDYALLKRQRLMQAGWPASALLMTVAMDEKNEGHAVLTARTAHGDFILDNKNDELKLWSKTGYRFVMRQSYLNPRIWMSLDPKEGTPGVPMAGVRNNR